MADKGPTLEDLARAEAEQLQKRDIQRKKYLEYQEKLLKDLPARFFTLARQVREGVQRFNGAAKLEKIITYHETAAVTVRDPNPAADFVVEVKREPNWFYLALRQMRRLSLPDAFAIEGEGSTGPDGRKESFRLRIDGQYKDDVLIWRITSDYKPVDTSIDEIADRLVAVAATGELSRLWTMAPFVEKREK